MLHRCELTGRNILDSWNVRRVLNVVFFLLVDSATSEFYTEAGSYTAYEDGTDSVPKRRHIKFRNRGITPQKNNITGRNMTSDWSVEFSGVRLRFPGPLLKKFTADYSETSVIVRENACQLKGHAGNRLRYLSLLTFKHVCHKITIR
jgi:hypothetical protein